MRRVKRRVKNKPVEPTTTTTFFHATQKDCPKNPDRNGRTFDCSCEGQPQPGAVVTIGQVSHNIKSVEKNGKGIYITVLSGLYYLTPKN